MANDTRIVEYAAMERAKKEIMEKTQEYEKLYNELCALVNGMAQYEGIDRKSFNESVENFKPQIAKMKAALDGYATALEKEKTRYEETQRTLNEEAKRLNGIANA